MLLLKVVRDVEERSLLLAILMVSPRKLDSVIYFMKKSIPKLNAVKYTTHNSSSLDYTMITNNSVVYIVCRLFITTIYRNINKGGETAMKFGDCLSAYLAPAQASNGFGTWRGGRNK